MTDPTAPAPASPYAAPSPSHVGMQQPYPGAPPVWTQPPSPRPSAVLAGTALALAIVGGLAAFVPVVGTPIAWVFLVPAVVLAIVALVRRSPGRGMSIASLVVAGVAAVVSVLWNVGFALFGSMLGGIPDEIVASPDPGVYSYPSLGVASGTEGDSREDALAFGTAVTIVDDNSGEDVWTMTVGTPQDATADAIENAEAAPQNGAYVAVPVELTNISDQAIDLELQYEYGPYTWLLTGDGGRAEITYLSADDRYPLLWDAEVVEPGDTIVYYDVYDVGAAVAGTGYLVVDLDSGTQIFWGS